MEQCRLFKRRVVGTGNGNSLAEQYQRLQNQGCNAKASPDNALTEEPSNG